MSDDLQQARISAEVLNEYRKIAAWLEAQAATRGPVGDTMHGLAAEALTNLIEHEYSRHTIPLYGMLDLWMALYSTSHPQFDEFYEKHGYAETWARLLAEVRSRSAAADAAVTVDGLQERIEDTLAYYQCRETNPKADHPSMGYHAFSEEQREFLRARKSEAAAEIVRMILALLRGGGRG